MFGHNKVFVPKSYRDDPAETLRVTSIFYTLQGEGKFSGTPCCFVRLMGCNLTCSFCDTYFDAGDQLSYHAIFEKIEAARTQFFESRGIVGSLRPNGFLLVITGGEPTNQANLTGFLNSAHNRGYSTQIESNGTIEREIHPDTCLCISPKINESIGKYVKLNEKMLERADFLKFVISKDMEGYQTVPDFALSWKARTGRPIYVSPMNCYSTQPVKLGADGTLEGRSEVDERISFWTPGLLDMQKNQANHEYAAELALFHDLRLSLQTHLMASLP